MPASRYRSGRAAGMGDAYIPLVNTPGDSLFYNPAGIAAIPHWTFEPMNIQFQGNGPYTTNLGEGSLKVMDLSPYAKWLSARPGLFPGAGGAYLPSFGFRGFAAGMLMQATNAAQVWDQKVRYRSEYYMIPAAGIGLPLASGIFRLSYSIQWVNMAKNDVTVDEGNVLSYRRGLKQGSGFSHTVGFGFTIPYTFLPAFNVVARNLGGGRFTGPMMMPIAKEPEETPPLEKMSIDASFSLKPRIAGASFINIVFEGKDVTNTSKAPLISRAAFGMEFTFVDKIMFRGGFGSAYPSAGFGLKSRRSEINFAWYSEDMGSGRNHQRDVRYMFQYLFRAF